MSGGYGNDNAQRDQSGATYDYVTVMVAEQMFGLPIERVHDVFIPSAMTTVPLAPREIMGLLNLRGKVVTAISLRRRLGLPDDVRGGDAMAIGIEHGGESYGLLVDGVGEVLRLTQKRWRPRPFISTRAGGRSPVACTGSRANCLSCWMSIPCWPSRSAKTLPDRPAGGSAMKLCLVVDDSAVIRKVARRILEGLDFQISEAEDGADALALCKVVMPDAVLLDWNMPVMDGYEFLRQLRSMPNGKAPKVVFCTTENDVAHIARAMHAGADEYIMKPFDKEIMTAKFQEVGLV